MEVSIFIMLKIFIAFMLFSISSASAEASNSPEWVSGLNAAQNAEQIAIVSGTNGTNARFSFHKKDETGTWQQIVSCPAYIGRNGWGKTREGDGKTPTGIYTFTMAFGIKADPGCPMGYTQADDSHYWVGDSASDMYNRFVSVNDYGGFSRKDSEHIIDYTTAYKYCLNISYNENGTPGKGSAIFLHCQTKNHYTAGCVAIPENAMREVLRNVREGCVVIMDTGKNIRGY